MKRRDFVAGWVLASAIPPAWAQQRSKVYRLAIAAPTTPVTEMNEASGHPVHQALFEELKRLGYVEGRNLVVERYSGEGRAENYPELGPVENQDSTCGLVVIQALDGTIRTDRRSMGEDGAALSG